MSDRESRSETEKWKIALKDLEAKKNPIGDVFRCVQQAKEELRMFIDENPADRLGTRFRIGFLVVEGVEDQIRSSLNVFSGTDMEKDDFTILSDLLTITAGHPSKPTHAALLESLSKIFLEQAEQERIKDKKEGDLLDALTEEYRQQAVTKYVTGKESRYKINGDLLIWSVLRKLQGRLNVEHFQGSKSRFFHALAINLFQLSEEFRSGE